MAQTPLCIKVFIFNLAGAESFASVSGDPPALPGDGYMVQQTLSSQVDKTERVV